MKISLLLSCLVGVLIFAGCDDTPATVQEGLGLAAPPHVHVFPTNQKTTFMAARATLTQMGYRFVRGGPAQGQLEAISNVSTGDTIASSEQFTLKATFAPDSSGGTAVSVKMTQILEEDSEHQLGKATETPMDDTPLYDVFFRGIEQAIGQPAPDTK